MQKKSGPSLSFRWPSILVGGFFILLLTIGLIVYDDFGVSWDETISRQNGLLTLRYVLDHDPTLLTYQDRYYGTFFETLLVSIEHLTSQTDPQAILLTRHLVTFLTNWAGLLAFFFLCRSLMGGWKGPLFGTALLAAHPRLAADAFYNSKDSVFLSASVLAVLTQIRFLKAPSAKNLLVHAITTGLVSAVRIVGLMFPVITISLLLLNIRRLSAHKFLLSSGFLICITLATLILTWPSVWESPVSNLLAAAKYMSDFVQHTGPILYFGQGIPPAELPWHYLPVWIGITTPLVFLALSLAGTILHVRRPQKSYLPVYAWFTIPFAYAIVFRPVMYDGWRHFYFLAPPMAVLAASAAQKLAVSSVPKFITYSLLSAGLAFPLVFMARNHPHFNVYFNPIVSGPAGAAGNFDLDYWGLSFRKGLDYIASADSSPTIPVFFAYSSISQLDILSPADHVRFTRVKEPRQARYVLTNFRWQNMAAYQYLTPLYSVTVDGTPIMSIYKTISR